MNVSQGATPRNSAPGSGRVLPTRSDQHFRRDTEMLVQASNHPHREGALSIQNFGDAGSRPDDPLQIPPGQSLLLHPELIASMGSGGSIG